MVSYRLLSMKQLIERINAVEENQVQLLRPDLLIWKEGASYDPKVTSKQFDELEKILANLNTTPFYLVDLSVAKRPDPEIVQLIEDRLKPIRNRFRHAAVYTGKNYLMFLGIKFYFIRFEFPSYSAHTNVESALKSFS